MLVAVYGTLRKDESNYRYYMDGLQPLSTEQLSGYDLYSLGSYPYATRGNGEITVEVYDVPLRVAYNMGGMEVRAGYDVAEVDTSQGLAHLFVFSEASHQREQEGDWKPAKIAGGDWLAPVAGV